MRMMVFTPRTERRARARAGDDSRASFGSGRKNHHPIYSIYVYIYIYIYTVMFVLRVINFARHQHDTERTQNRAGL